MKQTAKHPRRDLYQEVADRIAAGETWQRPYVPTPTLRPINLVSRRGYRGINWFLLALSNTPSGLWATYEQWQAAGAQVMKGQKGTKVVYWGKAKDKKAEAAASAVGTEVDPRKRDYQFLKEYTVFSAEQVEGFDLAAWNEKHGRKAAVELPGTATVHAEAERVFRRYHDSHNVIGPTETTGVPCYIPSADRIQLPKRAAFHSAAGYYSTWGHEITHSTGIKKRLDRDMGGRFGSEAYALEELVAELGAAMLCAAVGVQTEVRKNHACYVAGWLKTIREEKRSIFAVCAAAQQAADFVLGAAIELESEDELAAIAA